MSIFDKFRAGFSAGRDELAKQVARFKNRKFLEGTIAVCVGVAMSSDGVSSEEKQKMLGFIKSSPELKVFDTAEVVDVFNTLMSSFDFDQEVGKGEAMKLIVRLKDNPDELQLAIRVAIAVAKSDNDFDTHEQNYIRSVCNLVGLNPADFDL